MTASNVDTFVYRVEHPETRLGIVHGDVLVFGGYAFDEDGPWLDYYNHLQSMKNPYTDRLIGFKFNEDLHLCAFLSEYDVHYWMCDYLPMFIKAGYRVYKVVVDVAGIIFGEHQAVYDPAYVKKKLDMTEKFA